MPHLQDCATQMALAFGQALSRVRAPTWLLHLWVLCAASLSCWLMCSSLDHDEGLDIDDMAIWSVWRISLI